MELREYNLNRSRLLALLERLETAAEPGWTLYLPPGLPAADIEKLSGEVPGIDKGNPNAAKMAVSTTGNAVFWGEKAKYILRPPFPLTEEFSGPGYRTEPLRELVGPDYLVALVLVRLGAYGIGVFQGEKLIRSKVGTGLVHARHKKGGSSANRFARHREKQAEMFFTRVGERLREKLEPDVRELDYVVYGGEKATVAAFRKQCAFTKQLDSRTLDYLLNVREPKQASLEAAIVDAYSCRVWQWVDD